MLQPAPAADDDDDGDGGCVEHLTVWRIATPAAEVKSAKLFIGQLVIRRHLVTLTDYTAGRRARYMPK